MGNIKKRLEKYSKSGALRLHMPGHKGVFFDLDVTEIEQTGDINNPRGDYLSAIKSITQAYKSSKSYILTSGATIGIQMMVLYAKLAGYKLVFMRNSHISVINACLAFEADFDILEPIYNKDTNTYDCPAASHVNYLINSNEKIALVITNPDYYGRSFDAGEIKRLAIEKDSLIFADEAHGAHYVFSDILPDDASKYADIWVNGAHKTLGALTQGAFVHCSNDIDIDTFESIYHMLNTSSPSHLIALSLEDAVVNSLTNKWDTRAEQCKALEQRINLLENIHCVGKQWAGSGGYTAKDTTRLVLDAKDFGGGFCLYKKLSEKHNIQLEMADFRYATAIMTIYDKNDTDDILFNALSRLDKKDRGMDIPRLPEKGVIIQPIVKASKSKARWIDIKDSTGKAAAKIVGAYPPGTALLLPGEKIKDGHVKYLLSVLSAGGSLFGAKDGKIPVLDL